MVTSHSQSGDARKPAARKPRPRLRMAPELRRHEILDGALAEFSERGYAQATLEHVAERIGVTKGCLYHHFASKEQLLVELIRERVEGSVKAAEAREAADGRVLDLEERLRNLWAHFQEPGQTEISILAISELAKIPEAGRFLFDEVVVRSREPLRRAIRAETSVGSAAAAETERAAVVIPLMIMGVAIGLRLFRSIDPLKFSDKQMAQLGETVTAIIEHGAGAGAGASA
jgi:AcrR family transcriptional regulator